MCDPGLLNLFSDGLLQEQKETPAERESKRSKHRALKVGD